MTITVGGTSITFNDGTTQSTAAGAPTTAQVLSATAGASVGAVGSYAFLGPPGNTGYLPGATAAGSGLRYVAPVGYGTQSCGYYAYAFVGNDPRSGGTPAGTWRCMGLGLTSASGYGTPTLWLRIS